MNITSPHSGTAGAHAASTRMPLLMRTPRIHRWPIFSLDSSANNGQDFKSIAAALFGAESSSANPAQAAPKESPTAKKPAAGSLQEAAEARKSKDAADASQPSNPALGVPLLNAQPPIDVTLKLAATRGVG